VSWTDPELWKATFLSLIPGFFWLWYVESHAPVRSSRARLALGLLGGAASVMLTLGLSEALEMAFPWIPDLSQSVPGQLVFYVVVVGLVEELSKLVSARVLIYGRRDFQEPWDGLSASTCAALGFATAENVKYMLSLGAGVLVTRSVLSTFGHVLMSGMWGFALGLQKQRGGRRSFLVTEGLLWAAVGHGFYDFFLVIDQGTAAIGVLLVLWAIFAMRMRETAVESKRHRELVRPVRECGHCRTLNRSRWGFCSQCGHTIAPETKLYCSSCLVTVEQSAHACASCQAELTR